MYNIEELKDKTRGRKITILGHDNIDVDAFLSGILLSNLFNFMEIDNEFIILEKVNEGETYNIVKEIFEIDMKEWMKVGEKQTRYLFLEDHFETVHGGKVIGCIDHHPTNRHLDYEYQYRRNSCASAYLIYELMKKLKYPLTEKEAKMIVVSMMIDTTAFKSTKTIPEEVKTAEELALHYGLDYDYLLKYCLCLTPIDSMKIEEIVKNGKKHYNYAGVQVESSYLQLYGMPNEDTLNEWLKYLKDSIKNTTIIMHVFIIFETENIQTIEYQITKKTTKCTVYNGILSRGKDIMPRIEKMFFN